MKIGFIGVGNIGAPIAAQLHAAGHALVVHDVRPDAAKALVEAGATGQIRPLPRWLISAMSTRLLGPVEMEQVCLGQGGIVEHLKPGTLYIDHTTNAPALVRRVHAMLAAKDVAMLEWRV